MDGEAGDSAMTLLEKIRKKLEKLSDTFYRGRILKEGIRVSIAGIPNAGKSSLLNLLSGYDRAIVTEIPGTTRDTIEVKRALGGNQENLRRKEKYYSCIKQKRH